MADPEHPSDDRNLRDRLARLRRRQKRQERRAWARGFMSGICGLLRPGDLAIDCGANKGDVSAALLATGAEVIAFDPEPWAAAHLKARFADHPRFRLIEAAVGVEAGTVRLMRAGNITDNEAHASIKSTVVPGGRMIDAAMTNAVDVSQIDLIAFLQQLLTQPERTEIAFLKMDIEGAELDLLRAMDAAGLFASIRCTVVETHERKFRHLRPKFAQLRRDFSTKYPDSKVNLDWI